ncbi:hypothetical protein HY632_03225 [Candidatus Uhrbacteria bacterium]|nr:hypothetical protein [Candidatus Uhrbacteria bacterium]
MTLSVLLIPYAAFLVLFGLLTMINFYHMLRFGTFGGAHVIAILFFLVGTGAILFVTTGLLAPVDWSQPILGGLSSFGDGGVFVE